MTPKPTMFHILALRFLAAMVAVLAGLCLVVVVLALIVWAKGGPGADGMPQLAGGFTAGFVLCLAGFLLLRRRSARVEALLADQPSRGQD